MRTEELDYDLPQRLIAQEPRADREDARLLALDRRTGATRHLGVRDLAGLLAPGDVLVVNDTRVLRARVRAVRATGGHVEVLFLEPAGGGAWRALVRSGGSLRPGERLDAGGMALRLGRPDGEAWVVEPEEGTAEELMARRGEMPLPPYVRRDADDPRAPLDAERYQTVYAAADGAVAAPTAGLHLTRRLLAEVERRGARVATLTLHVGLGTFQPVRTERIDDHPIHAERYDVPEATAAALRDARARGGRIVAVGTTTVRALEAAALVAEDGLPRAGPGLARLLIVPGHRFRAVDAMLTNFHLPRSTLLALVAAFGGLAPVLAAYRGAVEREYRFFSYGDAMFVS